jgi:predicted acetyltransferase
LRLGLIEARKIGLRMVYVGADTANVASWKIIEANGGYLTGTFSTLDAGEEVRHYKIELA